MSSQIWNFFKKLFDRSLITLISRIIDCVHELAVVVHIIVKAKQDKAEAEKEAKREKEIDDVVKHGTLEDLLNMKEEQK